MNRFKLSVLFILIAAMSVGQTGCATKEAPSAGFVDSGMLANDPEIPFQKIWINPGFDKSQYTKLYVAPVNTSYMLSISDFRAAGVPEEKIRAGCKKLADYTRNSIQKAFREDPNARFQVLSSPSHQPGVLEIEIALTEVKPSNVAMNALGYAPFGIGLAIKVARKAADDMSSAAFEAKIRDAATRETVAMIANRSIQSTTVVSTRDFNWYSHIHRIIDGWSKVFVDAANRKSGETVKGPAGFTLKPW